MNMTFYFSAGIIALLLIGLLFFLSLRRLKMTRLQIKVNSDPAVKNSVENALFENQLAALETRRQERARIAADLHDELGSQVCAINMTIEAAIARGRLPSETEIKRILSLSSGIMTALETITWTLVSEEDTIENLAAYLRTYTAGFFEHTAIECDFHIVVTRPDIPISANKKRHVYLATKEILTNVLKHASASVMQFTFIAGNDLFISVSDNGRGPIGNSTHTGNGINNIKKRMKEIGGETEISNQEGTSVSLRIKL